MNIVELIKSDLYRYHGKVTISLFIKSLFFVKGFKFIFWLRLAKYYDDVFLIRWFPKLLHLYYKRVLVSDINYRAEIGPGFSLYHVFGTTLGENVILGSNNTMVHGVTIAGSKGEYPKIGNNVYFGAGCCVLGGISIGNNVVVGANAVVTKDVPDNAVVVGIPAKVISFNSSDSSLINIYQEA